MISQKLRVQKRLMTAIYDTPWIKHCISYLLAAPCDRFLLPSGAQAHRQARSPPDRRTTAVYASHMSSKLTRYQQKITDNGKCKREYLYFYNKV